jgi:DNA-binding Lrp family transcriptional regulator
MPRAQKRKSKTAQSHVSAHASDKRLRAYVLIQTVPGRVEAILRSLRRMPTVLTVDPVTGPYDIVALLAVDEVRDISHTVAGTIGGIRGVTRTTTLICAA